MRHQAEVVKMLRDARYTVGYDRVKSFLPKPLQITISAHDTGCQITIALVEEGRQSIPAWIGSVWYSDSYLFNDRDKILGIQSDAEFCSSVLEEFFSMVESAVINHETNRVADDESKKRDAEEKRQQTIEHFKSMF